MEIKIAIQCMDRRTKQKGTFGYMEGKKLYSVTPVFPDFVELIKYCEKYNIERDYNE